MMTTTLGRSQSSTDSDEGSGSDENYDDDDGDFGDLLIDDEEEDSSTDDEEDSSTDDEETGSASKENEDETEARGSGGGVKEKSLESRTQSRRRLTPRQYRMRLSTTLPPAPMTVGPPPTIFEESAYPEPQAEGKSYGNYDEKEWSSGKGGIEEESSGVLTTEKPSEVVHHHHFHHEIGPDHPYFNHIWRKHRD